MPFVPVDKTLLVEVVYEQDGQTVENTMYFESASEWTLEDVSDALGALNTFIQTELLPLLSNTLKLVRLVGTVLDAVDALSFTLNISPPVNGSATGTALPNATSYTVSFLTAARGRSNRGRNYVPGIPVAATIDNNHVSTDFRTGLADAYTTIQAGMASSGWTMVVVSRFSGVDGAGHPIPRAAGVTTPITTFTTFDDVLDSQRRRGPGRGA